MARNKRLIFCFRISMRQNDRIYDAINKLDLDETKSDFVRAAIEERLERLESVKANGT